MTGKARTSPHKESIINLLRVKELINKTGSEVLLCLVVSYWDPIY